MAISLVNFSTKVESVTSTTTVITLPAGTVSGDVLVAHLGLSLAVNTSTVSAPGGWTLIDDFNTAGPASKQAVFWLAAGGSEPASYTFTTTNADNWASGITSWRGVDTTAPIAAHNTVAKAAGGSGLVTTPAVTAPNGAVVLGLFSQDGTGVDGAGTWTPTAVGGFTGTEIYDVQDTSGLETAQAQYLGSVAPGSYQQAATYQFVTSAALGSIVALAPTATTADNTTKPARAAEFDPELLPKGWF